MSDQRRTRRSDTLRLLVTVALAAGLALTVTSGVAAATTPSLDCIGSGGGAIYEPGSGLTVYENHTAGTIDTFYFPDSDTVRFKYSSDGVNLSAAGTADVRLENGTGSTTCLANVNGSDNDITVAPDNDPSLIVKSNVSNISFRDPVYTTGDNAVDLAYENDSSVTLTFNGTGLGSGTTVIADDTDTGSELGRNSTDSSGAITLTLSSGKHNVDLHEKSDSNNNNNNDGGGGGGGGGLSTAPTPQALEGTTVVSESTASSRRVSGGTTTLGFDEQSSVKSISFDSTNVGSVTVQELSSAPESTGDPPGRTVSVSQITVPDDATDTSATIRTRVSADRLAELDATADQLQINRYNEGEESWQSLDTSVASESETGVVLEATTPGFSIFAVTTVDEESESTEEPEQPADDTDPTTNDTDTEDTTDEGIPGFGVPVALAALMTMALLARRKLS